MSSQIASETPARPGDVYDRVLATVAGACGTTVGGLASAERRGAREALARHVAIYLLSVVFERPACEIAARFRRHRTIVRYACGRVEDRRDDPAFDRRLRRLEQRLTARAGEAAR